MLLTLLSLGALIFLTYVFFTLFLQSVRSHHLAVKVLGGLLNGLMVLASVAALGAALYGLWQTSAPRALPAPDVKVTATSELLSRGQVLAQSCIPCHSADGGSHLNGGVTNLAAGRGPFGAAYGVVYAPNLTPGGAIQRWTDGEIVRAIREGIDDAGRPLLGHPSRAWAEMNDDDAVALVAYLRSQPALRHDQPRRSLNLLGLLAAAAGRLSISY